VIFGAAAALLLLLLLLRFHDQCVSVGGCVYQKSAPRNLQHGQFHSFVCVVSPVFVFVFVFVFEWTGCDL
jgi:hypothetical protein